MNNHTVSWWNQTRPQAHYPRLTDSVETDALVIGGGITGVTCAYELAGRGVGTVLIEAGALCDGTTGNTTGKVTVQHGAIYTKIIEKYGPGMAREYARSQGRALDYLREAAAREAIDCDLAESTAFLFALDDAGVAIVEKEHKALARAGLEPKLTVSPPGFAVENRVMTGVSGQAVLHPVRYVFGLASAAAARGAALYCATKAMKIEDGEPVTVHCDNGVTIRAKHVIMATGYPMYDGPSFFFSRLYPKRTYAIAVEAARPWPEGSYITAGKIDRSFRTHVEDGRRILIVVGDGHATGRGNKDMAAHFENLMQFAEKLAGVREVLAMWSAQDYETPDALPYIGRVSENSNVLVATGFGKWGLSNGTLSGILLSDIVTRGTSPCDFLYAKSRPDFLTSPGKTITGAVGPVIELIRSKLEGAEELEGLEPGEGRVVRFDGQKAGAYRDENDDVTILDITCTHMGTELNFNTAEKTWDCPAHGGRFGVDGKLLEGPPKNPLKVLFRGKYDDLFDG